MQERHDRILTESVMRRPAFQTSSVVENLHDKSPNLPDPDDIFAMHKEEEVAIDLRMAHVWKDEEVSNRKVIHLCPNAEKENL